MNFLQASHTPVPTLLALKAAIHLWNSGFRKRGWCSPACSRHEEDEDDVPSEQPPPGTASSPLPDPSQIQSSCQGGGRAHPEGNPVGCVLREREGSMSRAVSTALSLPAAQTPPAALRAAFAGNCSCWGSGADLQGQHGPRVSWGSSGVWMALAGKGIVLEWLLG